MVGNDVEEDLAAAKAGMMTYFVTDCLLNLKGLAVTADYTVDNYRPPAVSE